MLRKYSALVITCLCLAPVAVSESELYVSGGYSLFDGEGATLGAVTARGGFKFNDYFGIEGEGSVGSGSEDVDDVVGAEIELGSQYAAYLVGTYPLSDRFDFTARVGYGELDFDVSVGELSESAKIEAFAVGLGGEYSLTDNFGLRLDFTRFESNDGEIEGGVDAFTLSGVLKFGLGN
ncbi:MAG: porin family protein [Henriciella sp.]